ncbi:hypothetical protein [Mucilaginibacter lappiensis]|uniref:Uncharacterized protein n=1 Tax=Mucilaginibacter lappiensis TaxID=354630 RepID=A0A841JRN6_9SPHI|nr:hypothetical protein [Mucilaginibacter lappiensis]MBB6130945.1 hypothetical protein [Mucilaginibacter lappiensis]
MKILALRILPPMAIGRLGSSGQPLMAFDLTVDQNKPLDFRSIVPQQSFVVDSFTGELTSHLPGDIRFKDVNDANSKDGKIRPVAPFLEVFAVTDESGDALVPLTTELLEKGGYTVGDISWQAEVGNIKIFRRTRDVNDQIHARVQDITDHRVHNLSGKCNNFLKDKVLPLGTVQFIAPNSEFPQIRLRFTPAAGKVYVSSLDRIPGPIPAPGAKPTPVPRPSSIPIPDPIIENADEQLIYDKTKKWFNYMELADTQPEYTMPAQIFGGYNDDAGNRYSWGYLDDECDGFVAVSLKCKNGETLRARSHISAGPPAFAPDTLPIRVVSDELEQIILGPDVDDEVSIDEAEAIVLRALETIRLMNTTVMNGNAVNGQYNVASTMVRQNTNDFGRLYEPIMAGSIVDNLALRALHERIFAGLSTGAAPWFADVLRRPEEVGDLSSTGLRKMPALMRGADGRSLVLTRRMINMVIQAAQKALFKTASLEGPEKAQGENPGIRASNLTAQLHYKGAGNPYSVLPRSAISNCFPGLELDFRNLWRRAFQGIVLVENNNYIVETDEQFNHLLHCRLVAIEEQPTMVITTGPTFPGPDASVGPLITIANPNGVSFMEWSNNMASILQKQGQQVKCYFTKEPSFHEVLVEQDFNKDDYQEETLIVNYIFEKDTAVFSDEIIKPGEMTQGLCAPWQNDYRECACYYWAASRPDFVNVVPDEKGLSSGDSWMAKKRSGEYIPDNRTDSRLLSYDDLFKNWEGELNFVIKGKDATDSGQ